MTTDASLVAVGAVLEQDFGDGLQPVAYSSKKLTPTEIRYSAYERELLGIVDAIGRWRSYLEGHHFIVQTDHSSLRHLPNQPSVNRRIYKWVSILQGYNCEIRHIPGVRNPVDALTRRSWVRNRARSQRVKNKDEDLVKILRVGKDASDKEIQRALDDLYKNVVHETKGLISIAVGKEDEYTEASLAVSRSSITLSGDLKNEIREAIANEQPYGEIMQQIEEEHLNQLERDDGVYKIKHGVFKIHSPIFDGLFW